MTTIAPKTLFRKAAKYLLALPLLGLLAFATPSAQADDHRHRGRDRERHVERHDGHRSGYRHGGRYYSHRSYHRVRHSRYRDGRRSYYYTNEPYYYGLLPGGISVNIGL